MALMAGLGTPFAYVLARSQFRGRNVVITLVELPLVMPPAVAGLALLVAFGRFGLLGHAEQALGIDLAFTQAAVILAILFVASPFYLRGAIAAFASLDATLIDVAATPTNVRRRLEGELLSRLRGRAAPPSVRVVMAGRSRPPSALPARPTRGPWRQTPWRSTGACLP